MMQRLSFHDPDGFVVEHDGVIYRWIKYTPNNRIRQFLSSTLARELVLNGLMVAAEPCANPVRDYCNPVVFDGTGQWYRHEKVWFPSYPHEWVPEMLVAAGQLSLLINQQLINAGYILKDATAKNVLFDGIAPVFIDLLSIVRRSVESPVWRAMGQFERHFINPILALRYVGCSSSRLHFSFPDGFYPEDFFNMLGIRAFLHPSLIRSAVLPSLFGKTTELFKAKRKVNFPENIALSVLKSTISTLGARLNSAVRQLPRPKSHWVDYNLSRSHYKADSVGIKESLISNWLSNIAPKTVLDIGANTGSFSCMAAKQGAKVVALEADESAARVIHRRAASERLSILPLVMNFANPSPAMGWQGREIISFSERAREKFDLVLVLAVMHHLIISSGIPCHELIGAVAECTKEYVAMEYISPVDVMVKNLMNIYDYPLECYPVEDNFVEILGNYFDVFDRQVLVDGERTAYLLSKKRPLPIGVL